MPEGGYLFGNSHITNARRNGIQLRKICEFISILKLNTYPELQNDFEKNINPEIDLLLKKVSTVNDLTKPYAEKSNLTNIFSDEFKQTVDSKALDNVVYYTISEIDTSDHRPLEDIINDIKSSNLKGFSEQFAEDLLPILTSEKSILSNYLDPSEYLFDQGAYCVIRTIKKSFEAAKNECTFINASTDQSDFNLEIKTVDGICRSAIEQFKNYDYKDQNTAGLLAKNYLGGTRFIEIKIDGASLKVRSWVENAFEFL